MGLGGDASIQVSSAIAIVDFEDLGVPVGSQINTGAGICMLSGGYDICPAGLSDLHASNQVDFHAFNGTTVMHAHRDLIVSRPDGAPFHVSQFDFAGFPNNNEATFSVTALPSGVNMSFTPDGLVDSQGGIADFETFSLPSNFVGTSFQWTSTGTTTLDEIFALDNICVGPPCSPEIGVGCPGEGGFIPKFNHLVCDSSGQYAFEITQAPGGAMAVLLFGQTQASTPIGASGCFLNVGTLLPLTITLPLGGVGAGNGFTLLNGVFPPSASGLTFTMTAAVADPPTQLGFTTTNGLEVTAP